jgi:hypothetical protein
MDSTVRANLPYPGKVEPQQRDDNSRRQIAEANEAAWRDASKPHAVFLTERLIPQPLNIAAIVGGDRLKCVDFEPDSNPVTLIDQALDALREKLQRWNGHIPCFGKPTPFRAIHFLRKMWRNRCKACAIRAPRRYSCCVPLLDGSRSFLPTDQRPRQTPRNLPEPLKESGKTR